jgi:hypothetical protein
MANAAPALESFEATEANLVKLERLWSELQQLMPQGVSFGANPEYENRARAYDGILQALPKIDGWKPASSAPDLDDLAQNRFEAMDLGELSAQVAVEKFAEEPGRELREYRFRLNMKRRALIRDALSQLIDKVDADLRELRRKTGTVEAGRKLDKADWDDLRTHLKEIEVLLGSSVEKPARWGDLRRHASFADPHDLADIERMDWPQAKQALRNGLFGENEAIPVNVSDLSELVAARPKGSIATDLNWPKLTDESFERLIFRLISDEVGYENPEWLMHTRAPGRGRDLSVIRVNTDALSGTVRLRIIIQCKHWLSRSVNLSEAAAAKDEMALWANPRIDLLILATSGRFTADAVQWIETHNAKGESPRIEMWPESHLERLLASRPGLIAEFGLR